MLNNLQKAIVKKMVLSWSYEKQMSSASGSVC